MAAGSDPKDEAVFSLPSKKETTATKRRKLTTSTIGTLTSAPQLPSLPFDLVAEILCRLHVKLLLQLCCLCKFFKSLICDPKFAKKHLRMSTPRQHLMVISRNNLGVVSLFDSTIHHVLSTASFTQTQLHFPDSIEKSYGSPYGLCSCDGILCFTMSQGNVVLWNPCIRKFKMLPPLEDERIGYLVPLYSFGYDHFIHNYKIIAISYFNEIINKVSVYTLGTHFWRRIQDFPYSCYKMITYRSGVFVSGTVNWLACDASSSSPLAIVSLDLEKELYQKLWQPCLEKHHCTLDVLKDCLCIFASCHMFLDVWVMTEYGNKESWIKLYNVSYMREWWGYYVYTKTLYCYKDDQILIERGHNKLKFSLYNYKNGTLKFLENQDINHLMEPEIYVESLISPCF